MWSKTKALMFCCLMPGLAWSQEASDDREGLRVSDLSTVYLETVTEGEISGTLLAFLDEEIVVLIEGDERRFEMANVRRLQKKGDSLKNGAIVGAVIGAALGIFVACERTPSQRFQLVSDLIRPLKTKPPILLGITA